MVSPASPSSEENDTRRYDIVFDGQITEGRDIGEVKSNLAALYRVSEIEIEQLFADPPVIIKADLDYAAAMQDKIEFENTGAQCRVVPADESRLHRQRSKEKTFFKWRFFRQPQHEGPASSIRRFRLYHPPFMAFYSTAFYRDVAKNWRGQAFLFFVLLTAVLTSLVCLQIHFRLAAYIDRFGDAFVKQVPTITVQNGVVSIDQPQPYLITDPETGQTAAILDTTGKTPSLAGTSAVILLTSDRLLIKRGPADIQAFDLSRIEQLQFDRQQARRWMQTMRTWSAIIVFPLLLVANLLYRLAQILVYTGIGLIMTRIRGAQLPIGALLSLAIMAVTPSILLNAILPAAWAASFGWDVLSILITVGFLFFGIKSAKETASSPDEH